jgi:hypothetical protein
MTDHTDLVQRLRAIHDWHAWAEDPSTYSKAADTVEQLQARLAAAEADADRLAAALRLPPFIELRHIKDEALRLHDAKRSEPT